MAKIETCKRGFTDISHKKVVNESCREDFGKSTTTGTAGEREMSRNEMVSMVAVIELCGQVITASSCTTMRIEIHLHGG